MNKKLYEIEARWYVMAEDEEEAQSIKPTDIQACSVFAIDPIIIDADWNNAIPFNSDDNRTCGQILKEGLEV